MEWSLQSAKITASLDSCILQNCPSKSHGKIERKFQDQMLEHLSPGEHTKGNPKKDVI